MTGEKERGRLESREGERGREREGGRESPLGLKTSKEMIIDILAL